MYLSYDFPGEIRLEADSIYLSLLRVHLPKDKLEFVLDSYGYLRTIARRTDVSFSIEQGLFFVTIYGIKLNLTTVEEAFIATEVYVSECYNFVSEGSFVVIDIGMNVGFAALFFAARPDVAKVYSFEPFKQTFEQALTNFAQNPQVAEKIVPFNYGLGPETQSLTVDYDYANKGQVGIHGTGLITSKLGSSSKAEMSLRDASFELKRILDGHPEHHKLLKMDCEGAEYGILANLFDNGLLSQFRLLCIEWHEKGPEELSQLIAKSGYSMFCQQSTTKKLGMIYAYR